MAVKQDVNVGLIAFTGLVGAMILLITVWGVEAWYAYEMDQIAAARYAADKNVEWIDHKTEQYANIGDRVGNATIYAGPVALADDAAGGYRFLADDRQVAAIPIHAAMAAIVRANGGGAVSAEEMAEVDRRPVYQVDMAQGALYAPAGPPREDRVDAPTTAPGH